ncbi:hypothetical protein [Neolewinella antarctica]|uniref:Uncharacterized protein n=1 Tax=Neolewinella antarctica TaxID=442734 RepID=A0ABX0X7I6_9BACT|nr:hypothetical protein [Neolewinella antarctica]NJC24828.1 hypothetical protein [Neolewinella antarctica]
MNPTLKSYQSHRNSLSTPQNGRPVKPIVSAGDFLPRDLALEVLHYWNATLMLNDMRCQEVKPITGTYRVDRFTFDILENTLGGNPMAEQRQEAGWAIHVGRGGVVPETGIVCRAPSYNHLNYPLELRFVRDRKSNLATTPVGASYNEPA